MLFIILLVAVFILQLTIFSYYPLWGIKPDLLLVMIINTALLTGSKNGLLLGFGLGMIQDLYLGGMFGVYTIVKTIVGGLIGLVEGQFFSGNFLIPPLIIFIFTTLHELFVILLSEEMILSINYFRVLRTVILPEALYNAVLGLIIYYLLYKIDPGRDNYYG